MRVLITGGAGHVGRAMTQRFVQNGWDVHVIGLEKDAKIAGATYTTCDIMDYASVREQVRGCHAIVHLAAYASPNITTGSPTFAVNTSGTFNVFEAADAEGIKKIVQASSINAFGSVWGTVEISPEYFPIDEAHRTFTTDPYSFSKAVVEDIGAYYWRRSGIASVALRLPYVYPNANLHSEKFEQERAQMKVHLDAFAVLPDDERNQRLNAMKSRVMDFRRERRMELPSSAGVPSGYPTDDWLWHVCLLDRFDFWAYIDDRDAAQAAEKSLTAEYEGSHALFINADSNRAGYDSQTLSRVFFPQVTTFKRPVTGTQALVSIDKARKLIGFEPEYSI